MFIVYEIPVYGQDFQSRPTRIVEQFLFDRKLVLPVPLSLVTGIYDLSITWFSYTNIAWNVVSSSFADKTY